MTAREAGACTTCGRAEPDVKFSEGRSACNACRYEQRKIRQPARTQMNYAEYYRPRALMSKYGITMEEYQAVLTYQGGVCAICGRPPGKVSLAVDHAHRSGDLRGLLCSNCNHRVLGGARDSLKILQSAVRYLTDPPAQRVLPGARVPKGK